MLHKNTLGDYHPTLLFITPFSVACTLHFLQCTFLHWKHRSKSDRLMNQIIWRNNKSMDYR